jgi:tetratricopeptide (TPR) repeat protein
MSLQRQGRFADSEGEQRASLAGWQEAAEIDPGNTYLRDMVATGHNNLADSVRALGRTAEAREGYERAIAIRERLIEEEPENPMYRSHLAWSQRRRGLTRAKLGDAAGAAADARRALALWDALPTRSPEEWFETACAHAALAGLAGRDGSGIAADAVAPEADAAIRSLRTAVEMGYRDVLNLRDERALDPLRDRSEYRLLMMDLAIPTDPFAR